MDVAELGELTDAELVARSRSIERARRRVEIEQVKVMREIERRRLFLDDGHRDVRAWYRATHRWSTREANGCRRLGRLAAAAPEVAGAMERGELGVGQAHVLADAHANPRIADQVTALVPQLLEHARHEPARRFEQIVRSWVNLVDQDGSDRAVERALAERTASIAISDHTFVLRVTGPAADGVDLRAALAQQEQAEWQADWQACVAQHGADACAERMRRTPEQRRYDAFLTVAAGNVDAVVHLMADVATVDAALTAMLEGDTATSPARPVDLRRWCSQTTDGTFVPPVDVVLAAIRGRVRSVVTDERGMVLHMGRQRRLFTGAARDAVLLAATRCTHPGCDVPSGNSQADHLQPHSHGGATTVHNGGPACGLHNRWRYAHQTRTVLDEHGYWHTYRHDGTEVA